MKNFKRIVCVLMIIALTFSLAACGGGNVGEKDGEPGGSTAPEYTFSIAMDSPEESVNYIFAKAFKEELEERTDGRITLEIYTNGALGGDREMAESVQAGNIDFALQTTAPQVNFIKNLAVFDMPSVFPDVPTARAALDSEFFDTISKEYLAKGFKLLAFSDQGFRVLSTNREINSIDDFKGMKIRTMENPYHIEYWESVGANPTPMAFGEVYIGLQQGQIVAQENPYETIVAAKFQEQQKFVYNTNHIFHIITLITNPDMFNGLPADLQKAVTEGAVAARDFSRKAADERVSDRIKIIEDAGCQVLDISAELHADMQERAQGVYDTIRNKIGNELVDALLKAVEEAKK